MTDSSKSVLFSESNMYIQRNAKQLIPEQMTRASLFFFSESNPITEQIDFNEWFMLCESNTYITIGVVW